MKLIFASKSPRRKKLLSKFDINIVFSDHQFDEKSINKNINPKKYCKLIAEGKSNSILSSYNDTPILSADTIVVVENEVLEKPNNFNEAFV